MDEESEKYNKILEMLCTTREVSDANPEVTTISNLDPEDARKLEAELINEVANNTINQAKLEKERQGLELYLKAVQTSNSAINQDISVYTQNGNLKDSMILTNNSEDDDTDTGLVTNSFRSPHKFAPSKINGHMNTSYSLTSPMREEQINRYLLSKTMPRTPPPSKKTDLELNNDAQVKDWKDELDKRKANLKVIERKQQKLRNLDNKISSNTSSLIANETFRKKLKEQKDALKKQSRKLLAASKSRVLSNTNRDNYSYTGYAPLHDNTLTNSTEAELSQHFDKDTDRLQLDTSEDDEYVIENGNIPPPVRMIDNPYYLHNQHNNAKQCTTQDTLIPKYHSYHGRENIQRSSSSATYTMPNARGQTHQLNVPNNFYSDPPTDHTATRASVPLNYPPYYTPVPQYPTQYSFPASTPSFPMPYTPTPPLPPLMQYSLQSQMASPYPMYHSFPFYPVHYPMTPSLWPQPYPYPGPNHQQQYQFAQSFGTTDFSHPTTVPTDLYSPIIPTVTSNNNNNNNNNNINNINNNNSTNTAAVPFQYLAPTFPVYNNTSTSNILPTNNKHTPTIDDNNAINARLSHHGNPTHFQATDPKETLYPTIPEQTAKTRDSENAAQDAASMNIPFHSVMPNSTHVSSLYNLIKEKIYSEVVTLISNNETRPYYLIEMLRVLHLVNTDYLRQSALQCVKDIIYSYIHEEFIVSGMRSEGNSRIESPTQNFPISMNSLESTDPHLLAPAPSPGTSHDRCKSRHKNTIQQQPADFYSDDCHSVLSELTASDLESDSQYYPFNQQIRVITTELVQLLKDNLKEVCTPKLFSIIHKRTFSLLDMYFPTNISLLIQQGIDEDLRHTLLKFSNQELKNCGEDILISLTELLLHQTSILFPINFSESTLSIEDSDKHDEDAALTEDFNSILKPEYNDKDDNNDIIDINLGNGYPDLVIVGKHVSPDTECTSDMERPDNQIDNIQLTLSESRPIQASDDSEKRMTDDNNSVTSKTIDTISETQSCTASDYSNVIINEGVANLSVDKHSEDRTDNTSQDGNESIHSADLPPFANLLQQSSIVTIDPITDSTLLANNTQQAFTSDDANDSSNGDDDATKSQVVYSLDTKH